MNKWTGDIDEISSIIEDKLLLEREFPTGISYKSVSII